MGLVSVLAAAAAAWIFGAVWYGVMAKPWMAAAGLTRGGFYGYFSSKAELYAEVMRGDHDFVTHVRYYDTEPVDDSDRGAAYRSLWKARQTLWPGS